YARPALDEAVAVEDAPGRTDLHVASEWEGQTSGGARHLDGAGHAEDDRLAAPDVDGVADQVRPAPQKRRDDLGLQSPRRRLARSALQREHRERPELVGRAGERSTRCLERVAVGESPSEVASAD